LRLFLVHALLACCAAAPEMSDWERENALKQAPREESVVPPAFPTRAKLVEFPVGDAGGFRFFVDGSTLSVAPGGIVRYVLVAVSPGGVQNVTYEGLRCPAAEHRIYASGQSDRTWAPSRTGWQPVCDARRWQITLYREYFCPQKIAIRDAQEGVRALQAGGHPAFKGTSPQYGQ
jgi:hypothetical protein